MQQASALLTPGHTNPSLRGQTRRFPGKTKWAAARLTTRAKPKDARRVSRLSPHASVGAGADTSPNDDTHDDKTAFTILARNSPGVLQTISSAVADAGFNIGSLNAATHPIDASLSYVTMVVAPLGRPEFTLDFVDLPEAGLVTEDGGLDAFTWPDYDFMSNNAVPKAPPTSTERNNALIADLRRIPSVQDVEIVTPSEAEVSASLTDSMWRKFFADEDEADAGIKTMVNKDALDEGDAFVPSNEAPEDRNAVTALGTPDAGLLYLVHDFASYPNWDFKPHYDALARDPYVANIGIGRFRAYSKYRYFFPSPSTNVRAIATNYRDDLRMKAFSGQIPDDFDPGPVYRGYPGAYSMGCVVEVPDPKFNQPETYKFSGRADNVQAAETEAYYDSARSGRKFERVTQALASEPAFNEIIHRFCNYVRMDPRFQRAPFLDVGVHVIRIKADASVPDMRGQVVPEGMHQDGFDYIALGCVGSVNVNPDWRTYVYSGGADGAKPDVETESPFFSHSLGPGSMIFLDDGKCWHDADDLRQLEPSEPGWMDFVVVTLAAEGNTQEKGAGMSVQTLSR